MIVSTIDTIPRKKNVDMLGMVEVKSGIFALNTEKDAKNKLEKKAEQLGANAIVGYRSEKVYSPFRPDYVRSYGTAVVVEDEK